MWPHQHREPAAGWQQGDREPQSGGVVRSLADTDPSGRGELGLEELLDGERSTHRNDVDGCSPLCGMGDADGTGHEVRTRIGGYDAIEVGEAQRQAAVEAGIVRGWWSGARFIKCYDPDGEKFRPIEPSTFPLAHGSAARILRLRGYGDGINAEATTAFIEAALEAVRDVA